MNTTDNLSHLSDDLNRVTEIKGVIRVIASKLTIPLFLLFWIADLMYVPEFKWHFLFIRLMVIPLCFTVQYYSVKLNTEASLKKLMITTAVMTASGINLMIFLISDPTTPYYAGLGMVAAGSLSFMPLSKKEFAIAGAGIYLPYYLIVLFKVGDLQELYGVAINSFFVCGSILLCFVIRFFQEELRIKEIDARSTLKSELINREKIIRQKTDEAVKLKSLSRQFSPQVVESIRDGKIDIDSSGERVEICAIFVDIVNSTEHVNMIDKDKVEKVLTKFLDDSVKILLKYDITIDKFLGDGLLGFCNAPVKCSDFTSRVIFAGLEIREKIRLDGEFYRKLWSSDLEIRVGIAKGSANIGFYGSQKYYRCYTAIGSVVNLASRLCSSANANQILIDQGVFNVTQDNFKTNYVGTKNLKGFTTESIHVYEVTESLESVFKSNDNMECEACGSLLSLETDEKGHFSFSCKTCAVSENNSSAA